MGEDNNAARLSRVNVSLLNDDNYVLWSVQSKMLLISQGLWSVVSEPDTVAEAKKKDLNERALATLILQMESSLQLRYKSHTVAADLWTKLEQENKEACKSKAMVLRKEFSNLRMKAGETVKQYVGRACELVRNLNVVGITTSEDAACRQLVAGLPENFRVTARILSSTKTELTYNLVVAELEQDEAENGIKTDHGEAMVASGSRQPAGRRSTVCWHCGKKGHTRRECKLRSAEDKSGSAQMADAVSTYAL